MLHYAFSYTKGQFNFEIKNVVFSNMHCKLKVNCIFSIPKLKVKSKNKTFGIPKLKVYQNLMYGYIIYMCALCVCTCICVCVCL